MVPPFATIVVGVAEQASEEAGPYTLTAAVAVDPPTEAVTLHGCDEEFIEVAANRPLFVTAPQPPVTFQLTVEPEGAPLTVNCCWPPTGTLAEVGDSVRLKTGVGVVLIWK